MRSITKSLIYFFLAITLLPSHALLSNDLKEIKSYKVYWDTDWESSYGEYKREGQLWMNGSYYSSFELTYTKDNTFSTYEFSLIFGRGSFNFSYRSNGDELYYRNDRRTITGVYSFSDAVNEIFYLWAANKL